MWINWEFLLLQLVISHVISAGWSLGLDPSGGLTGIAPLLHGASPNGPISHRVARLQHGGSDIPKIVDMKVGLTSATTGHYIYCLLTVKQTWTNINSTCKGTVHGCNYQEVWVPGAIFQRLAATGSLWVFWVSYFSELGGCSSLLPASLFLPLPYINLFSAVRKVALKLRSDQFSAQNPPLVLRISSQPPLTNVLHGAPSSALAHPPHFHPLHPVQPQRLPPSSNARQAPSSGSFQLAAPSAQDTILNVFSWSTRSSPSSLYSNAASENFYCLLSGCLSSTQLSFSISTPSLRFFSFPKYITSSNIVYHLLTYFVYFFPYPHECKLFEGSGVLYNNCIKI